MIAFGDLEQMVRVDQMRTALAGVFTESPLRHSFSNVLALSEFRLGSYIKSVGSDELTHCSRSVQRSSQTMPIRLE